MTGLPQNEFKENFEVNKIRNSMLTPEAKRTKIQEVKKSFCEGPKNSSMKTVFNLSNCMVGSSIVVFPLIFSSSGLVTSLIVLAFVGVITCKTCLLEAVHFKVLEMDFPDVITRILGKKWAFSYCFCSALLLFITGVIYFMLICNMFYMVMSYIFTHSNIEIASKDEFEFGKFSYQYVGIIMICFCFILFNLKDLSVILKIGQYGIVSIVLFIIYIFYKGVENIAQGNVNMENIKIITPDFATLCGVFSLSFMCHNVIIPVIRNNHDESKNQRDIVIGYFMTGTIYLLIGVFGCFAIAGLNPTNKRYDTVLEYFSDEIFTLLIEILLFLQLISVMPILYYIFRSQFFNLIYKNEPAPAKYIMLVNVIFSIVCLIVQMLNVDPTLVISLNGSVIGYLLVYAVPIKIHLSCLYSSEPKVNVYKSIEQNKILEEKNKENIKPLIDPEEKSSTFLNTIVDQDGVRIENYQPDMLKIDKNHENETHPCRSNHISRKEKVPKKIRYVFYTALLLIGLAFAIIKIVNIIMGQ